MRIGIRTAFSRITTRCRARTGLQIEHQRPFAIYRSHDERFLRVLCGRHNRFEAERIYGVDFIQRKMDDKKLGKFKPSTRYGG